MRIRASGRLRFFFLLAFLLTFSLAFSVSASAVTYDGIIYSVYDNECAVVGCENELSGDVKVRDYVDGKVVVAIGEEAFRNQLSISSVELPDTITTIGDSAFLGCANLLSFDMPESVVNLGKAVFQRCKNLKSVKLSSNIITVPESIFEGCTSLEKVELSDDVHVFSGKCFFGCSSLECFVFPDKAEYITDSAFGGCTALKTLYLPADVIYIGANAFSDCYAMDVVYYEGAEASLDEITVSSGNDRLLKADWVYNHNHDDIASSEVVEPLCTEYGYTEIVCKCGYKDKIGKTEPTGHKLKNFVTVEQPDCKNKGKAYWYCSKCDFYEIVLLDVTPHSAVIDEAIPADCFSSGRTEGSHCHNCGEIVVKSEVIPALGHNFSVKNTGKAYLASSATYSQPAKYYYSCSRCNALGRKTFDGEKKKLGKPSKVTASSTSSSITLSWNKVTDADYYAVYNKNSKGKWKQLKKVTGNSLTVKSLDPGKVMTYAVRAYVTENGNTVRAPEYTTVTTATRPLKPSKVEAKQNSSVIKLTWPASAGATGYRVYVYSTKNSKWKVMVSFTTKCSATKSGCKSGTNYKFAVKPYIKIDNEYFWAESYTSITTTTKPLPPVLKATSLKGGVRLEWSKVRGADGYMIYYSSKPNSGFKKLKTTKSLTFTKTGLTSGQTYYFKAYAVKKLNGEYVYSKFSDVKTVKIK